jgi:hypothetical protein
MLVHGYQLMRCDKAKTVQKRAWNQQKQGTTVLVCNFPQVTRGFPFLNRGDASFADVGMKVSWASQERPGTGFQFSRLVNSFIFYFITVDERGLSFFN